MQRLQDAFHPVARALRGLPHRGLREAEPRSRHGAGVRDGVVILGRNTYDLPHWKRYRGGAKGVLWISRDGGRTFQKFLELPGNVTSPMLIGGRVYFVSDHEGVGNLYSVDLNGGDLRRHTDFRDFYVRNASIDGRRVVFQAGGDIYLYDPAVGKA
jgi:tricorn protease